MGVRCAPRMAAAFSPPLVPHSPSVIHNVFHKLCAQGLLIAPGLLGRDGLAAGSPQLGPAIAGIGHPVRACCLIRLVSSVTWL